MTSCYAPLILVRLKQPFSQCSLTRPLAPDGMNLGFYQHYWDVVGEDVSAFVLNCLHTCSFPADLNDTNVVLIPKKNIPESVADLKPIALCNVVYKVIAKMLANRMKHLLSGIISESQSAFIPGRLITDNILVAAEVGHFLNRKQCGVVGWGALKLDMAKAYDRMEWVARGAPPVSHLFFADNSLLFFKANIQEAGAIRQCLDLYEGMSGQRCMNKYWWGSGTERGIHWKAWDPLCVPKKFGGLGFKDLRAFNLAMLGKHAWRFLTMPNSLVAKIYKARYFPKSSFIDASLGNCPSFCWRSIMAAHGFVCGGVRRKIGNGKSTLVWGHPWLPDSENPLINTPMPPYLSGALVSGLMNEEANAWDHTILSDIFLPIDVDRIKKIPISPNYEDTWYWYGDPTGCYSVKHGYRAIVGDYVTPQANFDGWISLWKLKVPPKCKVFLWRALNDILPVTTNLALKKVEVELACPMCGLSHEDSMHALILCDFSQLVWHESHLTITNVGGIDFAEWYTNHMSSLSDDDFCMAVAILYHIWQARNNAVWNSFLPSQRKVATVAASSLHAWRAANVVSSLSLLSTSEGGLPPHQPTGQNVVTDRRRCFFDAGFDPINLKTTFGAVLLELNGEFVAACAGPLLHCFSPLMAETVACKEVLSWLTDRGVLSVDVFTDCAQLCSGLNSPSSPYYSYVGLFMDACRLITASFNYCQFISIP
ncbi:uncharacterized protein LOC116001379 [Ipomoea triloba]|uniref:uncharacterized protein LOC116001379 n=1 Tax=Ipomoea triloba TaxID=35885 RepID=UPI00125D41D6|nr:uncharacterized protein LOC116001379 [Ipomoea triloba]